MPLYTFICDRCQMAVVEKRKVSERDADLRCRCGRKMARDWVLDHRNRISQRAVSGKWPIYSDAAGVDPSQAQEAAEYAKSLGVPTDYTPDGQAVFRSPGHRRKYLKAHGLVDQSSWC